MAIKLAGTAGAQIGNVQLQTNVSGGYLNVGRPRVLPNAMVSLGQASQKLAKDLSVVDAKMKAERDEATLMNVQNKVNEVKHGMRADWSTQDNPNYAMGLNANKTWAETQTTRMSDLLSSFENGTFKFAAGSDPKDEAAFNEALADLSPAGKLALKKYLINQQDTWVSNLTTYQIQQTKIGVAAAAETAIAHQDQKLLAAPVGQVELVLIETLDLIDKKNVATGTVASKASSLKSGETTSVGESTETAGQGGKTAKVFSDTRFDPANMIEINDKVNSLIPEKIRNYLDNGQVQLARNLLEKYKRLELSPNNAKSVVKLTEANYSKLSTEIDAVNESVWINSTTTTVTSTEAFQEADISIIGENGVTQKFKQFDIVKVGEKLDALVGTPIMEMNEAGVMVPSDRRYTDADVKKLKARAAEMHTRNATSIKNAREELMERLTRKIVADPSVPITSLEMNGLTSSQRDNLRTFQNKEAGVSLNRPLVTDDAWLVSNFWNLTQEELAKKDASWINDTVLKHVKNGDETAIVSAWRTANSADSSKQSDAKRLDNKFNDDKANDINTASFKIYSAELDSRLANIQASFPSSPSGQARAKRVVDGIRAIALQEFYERQNVENSKTVITVSDANAIIDTISFKLVGDREGRDVEGTDIQEITIGQLISSPIQVTTNSSNKEKDIAKAQEVFSSTGIPRNVQFEVANSYITLHNIFNEERGILNEDGERTAPTFRGLADFVQSTELFVQQNVSSSNNVFQQAVDQSRGAGAWAAASSATKKQYIYSVINKVVIGNSTVSGGGERVGTVARGSTLQAEDRAVFQALKSFMTNSPAFVERVN